VAFLAEATTAITMEEVEEAATAADEVEDEDAAATAADEDATTTTTTTTIPTDAMTMAVDDIPEIVTMTITKVEVDEEEEDGEEAEVIMVPGNPPIASPLKPKVWIRSMQ